MVTIIVILICIFLFKDILPELVHSTGDVISGTMKCTSDLLNGASKITNEAPKAADSLVISMKASNIKSEMKNNEEFIKAAAQYESEEEVKKREAVTELLKRYS